MKRFMFAVLAVILLMTPVLSFANSESSNELALSQIASLINKGAKVYIASLDDTEGRVQEAVKIAPEVVKGQIDYLIWGDILRMIVFILGGSLFVSGIILFIINSFRDSDRAGPVFMIFLGVLISLWWFIFTG